MLLPLLINLNMFTASTTAAELGQTVQVGLLATFGLQVNLDDAAMSVQANIDGDRATAWPSLWNTFGLKADLDGDASSSRVNLDGDVVSLQVSLRGTEAVQVSIDDPGESEQVEELP